MGSRSILGALWLVGAGCALHRPPEEPTGVMVDPVVVERLRTCSSENAWLRAQRLQQDRTITQLRRALVARPEGAAAVVDVARERLVTSLVRAYERDIEAGTVQVAQRAEEVDLLLPVEVEFLGRSAVLSERGRRQVARLAVLLTEHPDVDLEIAGPTALAPLEAGPDAQRDPWVEGGARALALIHALLDHGVAGERIAMVARAVAPRSAGEGAARPPDQVELLLRPRVGSVPTHPVGVVRVR